MARSLIYDAAAWADARERRVLLFGMSGLGKTRAASMLRRAGGWFHYSVDYRIGTRYMGEHIVDNFKAAAMESPLLAGLLRSDSIRIASNITFDNLTPLSTYLGKPGDPAKGGLPFETYMARQEQHRRAEMAALLDTGHFVERARRIYGYRDFVCDSGGSICEVVDPDDPADPVLTHLSNELLLIWIEGDAAHDAELIRRFDAAPKPMYYPPGILRELWQAWLSRTGAAAETVDPDAFARHAYAQAIARRAPRYRDMAERWGVRVAAAEVASLRSPADFVGLIGRALAARARS